MTTRTYGTYELVDLGRTARTHKQEWHLTLEPAVAVRAKRMFARARQERAGYISLAHSIEIARDLEWFMERFPLLPATPAAKAFLVSGADGHRTLERNVAQVLAGTGTPREYEREPTKKARPYQEVARDLLRIRKRILLTDEVGLGKTYTALLNATNADALPVLIIPPTHLPSRWLDEIRESFPWLTVETAKTTTPTPAIQAGTLPDVLVVPYSKIVGWADHLVGKVATVLLDEAAELRNGRTTQKGVACGRVADQSTYVMGLTATPIHNYGGEIHSVLDIIAPGELGTREEFIREWGMMRGTHVAVRDPAALGSYLRETGLMLGRTRLEVGRQLPKSIKIPHTVKADPAALAKVAGDAAAMARLILSNTATSKQRFHASGDLDWRLREATGIAKAPYVAEFSRMLLESTDKILLFGWHRAVWDLWKESLKDFNPVFYTGTESTPQKDAAKTAFIDGDSRILMLSLKSGAGIDGLQKVCNTAVFGELDWSPQTHEQGIGRLRRDGMDEDAPPLAYFLTSESGSDPVIMETLGIKRQQSEPMLSKDGKLFRTAIQDKGRGRALAEYVLSLQSGGASKAA